ncbi:MAG: hypothetical protein ABI887_06630 [Burkholderiales bacterium]
MTPLTHPLTHRLAATLAVAALLLPSAVARAEEPPKEFSAAERALFMTDQLAKLRPPMTLRYQFHRSGSLEPGFDDKVSIALKAQGSGRCCDTTGEFLSGARKLELPAVEGATGNPVTLYFLERDVREMERLTKGKSAYFRKRIRMAVFQGAQQRSVTLRYHGKAVAGQEFTITPYLDDPNRPRFEQFANKRYVFTLSDAVPGGVYGIRALVIDAAKGADAPPLLAEDLLIDGADPTPGKAGS